MMPALMMVKMMRMIKGQRLKVEKVMLPHAIVLLHPEGKPRVSWGHIRGHVPRARNC